MSGDVSTRILPVTGRHSLFLSSQSCTSSVALRLTCLFYEARYRVPAFCIYRVQRVRLLLVAGSFCACVGCFPDIQTELRTFWLKPVSFFGLFHVTAIYRRFTYVSLTSIPSCLPDLKLSGASSSYDSFAGHPVDLCTLSAGFAPGKDSPFPTRRSCNCSQESRLTRNVSNDRCNFASHGEHMVKLKIILL